MRATRTIDGFSYLEVLVASALIAVAMVPAMQALSDAMWRSQEAEAATGVRLELHALMESVMAEPYDALLSAAAAAGDATTPTGYSDSAGATDRRLVFVARYDGDADPFTVTDPNLDGDGNPFTNYRGLLWVRTAAEDGPQGFDSLRSY